MLTAVILTMNREGGGVRSNLDRDICGGVRSNRDCGGISVGIYIVCQ